MADQSYAEMFREMMANWMAVKETVEQTMPDATAEEKYHAVATVFDKSLGVEDQQC